MKRIRERYIKIEPTFINDLKYGKGFMWGLSVGYHFDLRGLLAHNEQHHKLMIKKAI